ESDLGIDSIKMVEMSQNLLALVPESERDRFSASVPADQLMQLQTLGDIVRLFEPWQGTAAASVAPSPAPIETAAAAAQPVAPAVPATEAVELLPAQYPFL